MSTSNRCLTKATQKDLEKCVVVAVFPTPWVSDGKGGGKGDEREVMGDSTKGLP